MRTVVNEEEQKPRIRPPVELFVSIGNDNLIQLTLWCFYFERVCQRFKNFLTTASSKNHQGLQTAPKNAKRMFLM